MTQALSPDMEHGAGDGGKVGGFRFAFSKSRTGNPGLDAALERLGVALAERPPEEDAAAKARAESVRKVSEACERERQGAARKGIPGGRRFLDTFDRALADAKGMTPMEAARLAAKRTAHFFVDRVDGKVIDEIAAIFEQAGSAMARTVGADLAQELVVKPANIKNPIGVLRWRAGKRAQTA